MKRTRWQGRTLKPHLLLLLLRLLLSLLVTASCLCFDKAWLCLLLLLQLLPPPLLQ